MILPPDAPLDGGLHITLEETITEWTNRGIRERIVVPPGLVTDFSSIPDKGLLGMTARAIGLDRSKPWFTRSGKIHDPLYFFLKHRAGILPPGWYQFYNPNTQLWVDIVAYQWKRQWADAVWRRVSIEDGCPPAAASRGYAFLRAFGGIHMALD